jgi:hypothetical protein
MNKTLIALLLLLPTLALAGPKEIQGSWKVQLTAEDTAQLDALKAHAETDKEGDEMAKSMLKMMLAATEMTVTIDADTLTFSVMGETVPAKYVSKAVEGGWELATTNKEGVTKSIKASMTDGGVLQLTDPEGNVSLFQRTK